MGANYAESVYNDWSHLSHREHRALVRMALIVRDDNPDPRYWGGWPRIAFAIGLDMPRMKGSPGYDEQIDDTPGNRRLIKNAKEAVRRVWQELTDAGAITPMSRGSSGHNAVYRLNLTPVEKLDAQPE